MGDPSSACPVHPDGRRIHRLLRHLSTKVELLPASPDELSTFAGHIRSMFRHLSVFDLDPMRSAHLFARSWRRFAAAVTEFLDSDQSAAILEFSRSEYLKVIDRLHPPDPPPSVEDWGQFFPARIGEFEDLAMVEELSVSEFLPIVRGLFRMMYQSAQELCDTQEDSKACRASLGLVAKSLQGYEKTRVAKEVFRKDFWATLRAIEARLPRQEEDAGEPPATALQSAPSTARSVGSRASRTSRASRLPQYEAPESVRSRSESSRFRTRLVPEKRSLQAPRGQHRKRWQRYSFPVAATRVGKAEAKTDGESQSEKGSVISGYDEVGDSEAPPFISPERGKELREILSQVADPDSAEEEEEIVDAA
jgi:hypothetical protein